MGKGIETPKKQFCNEHVASTMSRLYAYFSLGPDSVGSFRISVSVFFHSVVFLECVEWYL